MYIKLQSIVFVNPNKSDDSNLFAYVGLCTSELKWYHVYLFIGLTIIMTIIINIYMFTQVCMYS